MYPLWVELLAGDLRVAQNTRTFMVLLATGTRKVSGTPRLCLRAFPGLTGHAWIEHRPLSWTLSFLGLDHFRGKPKVWRLFLANPLVSMALVRK